MQPPNYQYPPQGPMSMDPVYNQSNYPPHNSAVGGNVTYTHGGALQTSKHTPPATSGSIPSQQPPVTSVNGYYNGHQYQSNNMYHSGPQMNPPPTSYNQPITSPPPLPSNTNSGMNNPPASGYQQNYQRPPTSEYPQQPGYPVSGAGEPPRPNEHSYSKPNQPPYQPIHQQMSNMSINNQNQTFNQAPGSYMPPPSTPGYIPPPQTINPTQSYPQPGPPGPPGPPGAAGVARPPNYPNQPVTAPPKRLDPDAMPSPIQVIQDDKINRGGEGFRTEGRGLVPPLVTTQFTVEDMGSVSPRYVRCTAYNLPATADMAKNCQVPMSLCVKPLSALPEGESPPFIVDPGPDGPIRCKRCKAYMCPQFTFTDGGRRFQCVLCNAITDTPHSYFDHLDHMNQRVDKYRRPELCRGSYEFIATKDYCRNDKFPLSPAFIFAIDVSYNAMKSGYVDLLCRQLHTLLDTLPKEAHQEKSSIRVGFITYNNVLHFYNLKSSLAQPQMMVVSDVNDVFVPLQDGFLVDLDQSRHVIDSLLDQIPDMFRDTRETELVFAPVIQAAVQALKSAECAGKLFMFHTSLPIGEAPGKLKNRDDRKLIATDKEKVLFNPASNFYEKLAKDCVAQACCVDLFLFPNQYVDVATLSQVPQYTGGQVYKYNFFRSDIDGSRFIKDFAHDLQRDIVFDAIMRVRTSTGIRAVQFYGSLYMGNTTDVELAAIDCDKAIQVELKHDDKIAEEYGAYVQIALLYTSVSGQRRLRLHNLNLSVCTQLADLYRSCETDVLMNYLAKKAVVSALQSSSAKLREELINQISVTLATYRKHVASPSSPGQLILPECMKLLPVYLNCLLKNDAIHSSHDVTTDDRAYLRHLIISMDVSDTQTFLYPRLIPVFGETVSIEGLPPAIRCSEERMKENEAYLLENAVSLFLWIGQSVDPAWIQNVFGVQSAAQIDIDLVNLVVYDNEDSRKLRDLVAKLQASRNRQMKFTIVRQRDKLEPWFKHLLAEDRGAGGATSYVDFLCHMHKEIRALLN